MISTATLVVQSAKEVSYLHPIQGLRFKCKLITKFNPKMEVTSPSLNIPLGFVHGKTAVANKNRPKHGIPVV